MIKVSNRFAVWLATGRIFSMLVVFAMPLIMTRFLSQSDYGVFSQYFTLYMAFNVIFALGFHSNLFYFYPTANAEEKDEYVTNTLCLLLAMSVVAALIISSPFVADYLFGNSRIRDYSLLVTLSIALAIPVNMISPLLTVREDKWGAVFYPGLSALLRVGAITITALIWNNLYYIFISLIIYQVIILIWILFYTLRNNHFKIGKDKLRPQILYSIPFGLTVAIQIFSNYFDKIVSIRFLDDVQYAIYATAFLSIPGINQIYDSLCQVNVVNMNRRYKEGSLQDVRALYKDFVVKTLSFSTPVILAVSLFAEEIIVFLYPAQYLEAARYFRIYSLTFLTAMFGAGTILRAIGKTHYSLISFVISSIIGLPLTFFLIKNHGIEGAICGAAINIMFPRFIQMFFEIRQTLSNFMNFLPWRKIGYIFGWGVLALSPLYAIKHFLAPRLVVCIIISGIYIIVVYWIYLRHNVFLLSKESVCALYGKITNLFYRNGYKK